MYNAWRQQITDVSVIHLLYCMTMKNAWNLILIVFCLLPKFKVKGVGGREGSNGQCLSWFQWHQKSKKKCKEFIFYTAICTTSCKLKYFRYYSLFWLDGSAYDLALPCDPPAPSLIKIASKTRPCSKWTRNNWKWREGGRWVHRCVTVKGLNPGVIS